MFRSIRWKLVFSYVILAVVAVSLVGLIALEIVRRYTKQQQLNQLQANARSVAYQAGPLMAPVVRGYDLDRLVQTTAYLGNLRVQILDTGARALVDSGAPSGPSDYVILQPPSDLSAALFQEDSQFSDWMALPIEPEKYADPLGRSVLEGLAPGTSWLIIRRVDTPWGSLLSFIESSELPSIVQNEAQDPAAAASTSLSWREPIQYKDELLGFVEITSSQDLSEGVLAASRQAFLLAAIGSSLLAITLGLVMSNRIASPLNRLKTAAIEMGSGNLDARAPVSSNDEIGAVSAQFNWMAGKLKASFFELAAERDALRRFIADASHELRTPITALKNFITLLQDNPAEDPEVRSEFLAESQTQVERLEWITSNLLDLSRLDAGISNLEFVPVDVLDISESVCAPFRTAAQQRQITLLAELPDQPLTIVCDRKRMEIALSNLVDNAIKFSPDGSTIRFFAGGDEQTILFSVTDQGPGIPQDELGLIFDRFYRGRHPEIPGSGLGLSIVESIIHAHGGTVTVESDPGHGAKFTVSLPAQRPGIEA
jgi:signal transduction histidine kinase